MMVFLGGIVGGLLIAMYLPIFEMAGNIKSACRSTAPRRRRPQRRGAQPRDSTVRCMLLCVASAW